MNKLLSLSAFLIVNFLFLNLQAQEAISLEPENLANTFIGNWCYQDGILKIVLNTNGELTFKQSGYEDTIYNWQNVNSNLVQYSSENLYIYFDSPNKQIALLRDLNEFKNSCPEMKGCEPSILKRSLHLSPCN